jgi:hypothetical protein
VASEGSPPPSDYSRAASGVRPAPAASPRPSSDRLTVGKLIDHGRARHEFHPQGYPSFFVKILTDDGPRTVWARGLERALQKSRTQPQVGDVIGLRENNIAPVSFITRTRNAEGLVVATRQTDTPRPHWVIEKLEDFDLRAAAARALRDPTLSRREAVLNHRELKSAYELLDTAQTYAANRWENPKTREIFIGALRETLALTIERGMEMPRAPQEPVRAAAERNRSLSDNARTHE